MGEAHQSRAHSPSNVGHEDSVADHLTLVSQRAARYASAFGAGEEARVAGLLHDLGKYGERFQKRLRGEERGIDHWSAGAWEALMRYKMDGVAAAVAIQGHHIGLQHLGRNAPEQMSPDWLADHQPGGRRLSADEHALLVQRMADDGIHPPSTVIDAVYDNDMSETAAASLMLDIRMLFSTLVDADFIETEAHFQAKTAAEPTYRPDGPDLRPDDALRELDVHLERLATSSTASDAVRDLRQDLLQACRDAAEHPPGVFTLTAPTGAGKTLGMLAFALKHAQKHGLRRVVMVIPYLSIIEQTVGVYREALAAMVAENPNYVLEHHSLARNASQEADNVDRQARLLAQNWDAPVIVTTSVQMLESLFANRPSQCRKLHRLADSVILFDEVQTLPEKLAVPTLATLSRLSERFGSTVVFSTATQPAFDHLHERVADFCAEGWKPVEIAPEKMGLFDRARRTTVDWSQADEKVAWPEMAERLADHEQVLCITNIKRHAAELYDQVKARSDDGLFHLSTSMCPAHRTKVLAKVRSRLDAGEPCRLISTQCVEAGVDVDFPVAYRALAPLDAIAQAAGRCNREGHRDGGDVHVFVPDDTTLYPGGGYRQAAQVTLTLLKGHNGDLDIHDPAVFYRYYRELYGIKDLAGTEDELIKAIRARDFMEVAKIYRLIPNNSINVLVPYDPQVFERLAEQVGAEGLSRDWITAARPHTIGVYTPKPRDSIMDLLEPVYAVPGKEKAPDWWIYRGGDEGYDGRKGLVPRNSGYMLV